MSKRKHHPHPSKHPVRRMFRFVLLVVFGTSIAWGLKHELSRLEATKTCVEALIALAAETVVRWE